MKKLFTLAFLSLFIISCSDDSESDISTTLMTEETPKDTSDTEKDETPKLSFAKDIVPIISNKCTPCHVNGGDNTNYSSYLAAKNNAEGIKNRVNRAQGSVGFMPNGRTKLSASELDKISQWITDGKLE